MTDTRQKALVWALRFLLVLFGLMTAFLFYASLKAFAVTLADHRWQEWYFGIHVLFYLPVFAALVEAWNITTAIGRNNSFCQANVRRLRRISRYALVAAAVDTVMLLSRAITKSYTPMLIDTEVTVEAGFLSPDGMTIWCIVIGLGAVAVAVAAAALSYLTAKAATIQDENDLTI
jgi:hypothetical protein